MREVTAGRRSEEDTAKDSGPVRGVVRAQEQLPVADASR